MRIFLTPFALVLLSLLFSFGLRPTPAQPDGPSASGSFEIYLENGSTRHIEFHAELNASGTPTGETIFRDNVTSTVDSGLPKPLFLKAEFDCLVVEGNQAVMSGAVTESSWEQYIGRRVLIVAQENGGAKSSTKRDKITWGVYRTQKNDPLVVDAERPNEVSSKSWLASDAERPDDEGAPSNKEMGVGCQSFPLSSYTFISAKLGQGSVRIKP